MVMTAKSYPVQRHVTVNMEVPPPPPPGIITRFHGTALPTADRRGLYHFVWFLDEKYSHTESVSKTYIIYKL